MFTRELALTKWEPVTGTISIP